MELNTSETLTPMGGATWPPPSTEQSPVYEFKLNHAMIRSRAILFRVYQPNFWRHKLEIGEHGVTGFLVRTGASNLPWSDIEEITIARIRRQVCISYHYPAFGFKTEMGQIFSVDPENFDLLGVAIKRYAKCAVVEDDKIYWSYSKLMIWYSVFWLCELSLIVGNHHGQWLGFWRHVLGLLNHLVATSLP